MNYLLIDQPISQDRFFPFALTDVLVEYAGAHNQKFLHFWQLEDTMILGMKDTRVPHLNEGLLTLYQNNYTPVIRNSGGLGVINDAGVLNISLIFPKDETKDTDHAYKKMHLVLQQAFPEITIDAYEIINSYCPGAYDLSVKGKKIAGIAQRRVKSGVAVMLYLSVSGNQETRGKVVQNFYQASLQEKFGKDGYPAVDPKSMTTLTDVFQGDITVAMVKKRILTSLCANRPAIDITTWLNDKNQELLLADRLKNMVSRNQLLKEFTYEYPL